MKNLLFRVALLLIVIFIGMILFFSGFREVRDGYMAVETSTIGQYQVMPKALNSGWYWRRPLIVNLIGYPITRESFEISATTHTSDKRQVKIYLNVSYQLDAAEQGKKIVELHKEFGSAYELEKHLQEFCAAAVVNTIKNYSRDDVFGKDRETVANKIKEQLLEQYGKLGVNIEELLFKVELPSNEADRIPTHRVTTQVEKECHTKDRRKLSLKLQVRHRIDSKDREFVYENLGQDYTMEHIVPVLGSIAYNAIDNYKYDEIYHDKRDAVVEEILKQARAQFEAYKVHIVEVAVDSFGFDLNYHRMLESYTNHVITSDIRKECHTSDKKRLTVAMLVQHHIEAKDAEYVHNNLGSGYKERYIAPTVKTITYNTASNYTLEEIYGDKRDAFVKEVLQSVRTQLADKKLQIDALSIESIEFDANYQQLLDQIQNNEKELERIRIMARVEEERAAAQEAQKKREREQAQLDAKAQKERQVIEAEGVKQAAVLRAQGEAEALTTVQKGRAEALVKVQKIIAENPHILRYLYIDKISDKVKVIVVPANEEGISVKEAIKAAEEGK